MYAAKRFSCGPGADRRDPTKQFYLKLYLYNTVILAGGSETVCVFHRNDPDGIFLTPELTLRIRMDLHYLAFGLTINVNPADLEVPRLPLFRVRVGILPPQLPLSIRRVRLLDWRCQMFTESVPDIDA